MDELLNQQLLLELFLSRLKIESCKTYEVQFKEFLDDVIAKAPFIESKADKRALREFMTEALSTMYDVLMIGTLDEAKQISLFETALLYEMYGVAGKTAETYLATLNSQTEIHGYKIGDSFKNNREYLVKRLSAIISNGIDQNETSVEIKRGIKKAGDKQLKDVDRGLINSIIQSARSFEREFTYRVIEKEIDGYYLFDATLDNKTSKGCAIRSGARFYTSLDNVPSDYKTPRHRFCRSILLYIPNNYTSQNVKASKQYNADGTSKGKQIKDMSYSEWFAFQPKEIQKKYLGKKNFELYESGVKFEELFRDARRFSLNDVEKDVSYL